MKITKQLSLCLLAFVLMGSAVAHQLKSAATTVLFNDRTGNIEVMHRFNLHDAEHAIGELFGKQGVDMHKSEETRALFAAYVLEHFALAPLNGDALALETVGYQIEGNSFWVYQEVAIPEQLQGLQVRHSALQEIWAAQQNLVNIERNNKVQSLQFNKADNWQQIQFN